MQRFTLFSLILSVSVVLIICDLVFNNYLGQNTNEELLPVPVQEDVEVLDESTDETVDQTVIESNLSDESVSLQSEEESLINADLFSLAGFLKPTLKEASFSGLIFQFIPFDNANEAKVFEWNLFDGENYVGSVYEIKYATDTGAFQGYLTLRDAANALNSVGEINEANNYGDASFYFNHNVKVKTVHLIMRSQRDVFAFAYAQSFHENMKKVFDIL